MSGNRDGRDKKPKSYKLSDCEKGAVTANSSLSARQITLRNNVFKTKGVCYVAIRSRSRDCLESNNDSCSRAPSFWRLSGHGI